MGVNLKSLIAKLNDTCRSALEGAAGLCLSRTHYDVDIEHLLLKLIEMPDIDLARILRQYEIDASRLSRDLTRALDRFKTGNARTPALSPRIPKLIGAAWTVASIDFGVNRVRSGHLLLALLEDEDLSRLARESAAELAGISPEDLRRRFVDAVAGSPEDRGETAVIVGAAEPGRPGRRHPALREPRAVLVHAPLDAAVSGVDGEDAHDPSLVTHDCLSGRRDISPL